jgi:hypothetical protein
MSMLSKDVMIVLDPCVRIRHNFLFSSCSVMAFQTAVRPQGKPYPSSFNAYQSLALFMVRLSAGKQKSKKGLTSPNVCEFEMYIQLGAEIGDGLRCMVYNTCIWTAWCHRGGNRQHGTEKFDFF